MITFIEYLCESASTGENAELILITLFNKLLAQKIPSIKHNVKLSMPISCKSLYKNNKQQFDDIAQQLFDLIEDNATEQTILKQFTKSSNITPNKFYSDAIKKYNITNNTFKPKTDIISLDKNIKISCKMDGDFQLQSGGSSDTIGTLRTALSEVSLDRQTTKIAKQLLDILDNSDNNIWQKAKKDEQLPISAEQIKEINVLLAQLMSNRHVLRNIVYQAITGVGKFGKNNDAVPNIILIFNKDTGYLLLQTVIEFISDIESGKHHIEAVFSTKSNEKTRWPCMRIKMRPIKKK